MEFIDNNQCFSGAQLQELLNLIPKSDPTCTAKSREQNDRISDQEMRELLAATSENEVSDPSILKVHSDENLSINMPKDEQ